MQKQRKPEQSRFKTEPKNKPYLREVKASRRGPEAPPRRWKSWLEYTLAEKD